MQARYIEVGDVIVDGRSTVVVSKVEMKSRHVVIWGHTPDGKRVCVKFAYNAEVDSP